LIVLVIAILVTTMLSACGDSPATESSPSSSQPQQASASQTPEEPQPSSEPQQPEESQASSEPQEPEESESSDASDNALAEAHEDVQGDMENHNSWYDEEKELLLSYPNVFEPIGELDADGYMRFKSLQTEGVELVYWVTPNTYEYTPAEFIADGIYDDMLELEGNAVIGRFDDLYQETGEIVPTAYYWVVDTEWIVNVAIHCDTPEYRDVVYEDLQNSAVFVESVAGIEVMG
jgi:hypothetical protein